jgi:hypothetical protein
MSWYTNKKFLIGSALTVVMGIAGWIYASSSISITGLSNKAGIVTQGQKGNNFIITRSAPQQSELEHSRRNSVVGKLRQEYVLSHDGLSPALLAGTEPVPPDWMNTRLEQMGELWRVRVKGTEYEIFSVKPLSQ